MSGLKRCACVGHPDGQVRGFKSIGFPRKIIAPVNHGAPTVGGETFVAALSPDVEPPRYKVDIYEREWVAEDGTEARYRYSGTEER